MSVLNGCPLEMSFIDFFNLVLVSFEPSGRGVTVAYMLWEHAVRVQISAPRK